MGGHIKPYLGIWCFVALLLSSERFKTNKNGSQEFSKIRKLVAISQLNKYCGYN